MSDASSAVRKLIAEAVHEAHCGCAGDPDVPAYEAADAVLDLFEVVQEGSGCTGTWHELDGGPWKPAQTRYVLRTAPESFGEGGDG